MTTMQIVQFVGAGLLAVYGLVLGRRSTRQAPWPIGFFFLWLLLSAISPWTARLDWYGLQSTITVVAHIAVYFGVIRVAAYLLERLLGQRRHIAIPAISRDVVLFILYVITVMVILRQDLRVDLTSLVATSAILTAVLGLALQETLGNLFSGLALQLEKPYKLGDWVAFERHRGQVLGMGWRATTILTPELETITIPNNLISRGQIVNYSDPSSVIVSGLSLGLGYDAPPNRVREVVLKVVQTHPHILRTRDAEVRVVEYGDSAIKYDVRYCVDIAAGLSRAEQIKSELLTRLWYQLRRDGIRVPYPIRIHYQMREHGDDVSAEIEAALVHIPVFAPLTPEDRQILARNVDKCVFAAGETVVEQGAAGDCMYVIASGSAEVSVRRERQPDVMVATLDQGQFFGEMSLMTGAPRTATVIAKTDMILYAIDKGDMLAVLANNPTLSTTISEILATRLQEQHDALAAAEAAAAAAPPPSAPQILQRIRAFFRLR